MGKLAVVKYFSFMMLVVSIIVAIATFAGIFGGNVSPVGNTSSAMLVYVLPILIVVNIIILIYWIIRRNWVFLALPAISLLACIPYIGTIYQFGLFGGGSDATNTSTLKVCSYNVAHFNHDVSGFIAQDVLAEMKKQGVDVFCIQEYIGESGEQDNSKTLKEYFPYMATGNRDMAIFSKYPIADSKNFPFEGNNSFMWADIKVNGKTVRVFNAHLETTGFNSALHKAGKIEKRGGNVERNALLRAVYNNYTLGMITRAEQAEAVAKERDASPNPTVIAGDLNDVPYSYVYKTVKGDLNDGFREAGKGFMYTFRGGKKMFRIDYIFADKSLKATQYYRSGLTYSDHFPVFMQMQ